jgi:hypothetical protein
MYAGNSDLDVLEIGEIGFAFSVLIIRFFKSTTKLGVRTQKVVQIQDSLNIPFPNMIKEHEQQSLRILRPSKSVPQFPGRTFRRVESAR